MQKINQTAFPEKEEFAKKNCPCRSDLADIVAYPYPVGELQRRVVKPMGLLSGQSLQNRNRYRNLRKKMTPKNW